MKNIKDGRLYILVELNNSITAVPLNSEYKPISDCDINDFIPVSDLSKITR